MSVYSLHSSRSGSVPSSVPDLCKSLSSSSEKTPVSSGTEGRRTSLAPNIIRVLILRRLMRSKSPAPTASTEAGITPISYCEMVIRKSRANSSDSIGESPSTCADCSRAEMIISHNWRYSSASLFLSSFQSRSAFSPSWPGISSFSRRDVSAFAWSAAVCAFLEASSKRNSGAISFSRSRLIFARRSSDFSSCCFP